MFSHNWKFSFAILCINYNQKIVFNRQYSKLCKCKKINRNDSGVKIVFTNQTSFNTTSYLLPLKAICNSCKLTTPSETSKLLKHDSWIKDITQMKLSMNVKRQKQIYIHEVLGHVFENIISLIMRL